MPQSTIEPRIFRRMRKFMELTKEEFAKEIGVDLSTAVNWEENGLNKAEIPEHIKERIERIEWGLNQP